MVTAIKTVEELEGVLKSPEQMADYIGQVAMEKMGDGMTEIVKGAVTRAIAKANLPGRPNMTGEGTVSRGQTVKDIKAGIDAPLALKAYNGDSTGGYKRFGEFLLDLFEFKQNRIITDRIKAAFAEGSSNAGGALVPTQYVAELKSLALEDSQFRPRASVIPMASALLRMPYVRDTSHATSVFGGITGNWAPEAGALVESEASFGELELRARKLSGYTVASNEILADGAVGLEAFLMQRFPQAIRWFEEQAFWTGQGGGEPLGILNSGALLSVTRTTASHIVFEDLVNMDSQILPMSASNVVWFAHPKCKQDLYTMALNVGTGGSAIFLNAFNGGVTNAAPAMIFGRPLVFTEHLSTLGTAGDIVAADLSYYLIGDRQDLAMEASQHVKFTSDQTVWRWIERLDGRPWLDSALTLHDGSFQVSPFVALAT